MILLSIIIPAYNVEKYITNCLDSCFAMQRDGLLTEEELEVIVVDDGSTDATSALLKTAVTKHPNLRVFWQVNQGQSVARNLAIKVANGNYIYMVDADDALNREAIPPIQDIRDGYFDIIGVQVLYKKENRETRPWSHQMEKWPFDQEFQTSADFLHNHNIEGLVYGYLFRRELFETHQELRFTPGIYHQDEELIFKLFTMAGRTIYRRGYLYEYYEHTGSSLNTKTPERKRKLMADHVTILKNLVAWRDRYGEGDDRTLSLRETMHYKLSYLTMDMLRFLIRGGYDKAYIHEVIDAVRQLKLYPLPYLHEFRFLVMKCLTCHPELVSWWARHRILNQKIGF